MRHHFTPNDMAITKNKDNNKCWQGCVDQEPSHNAGENVKWYSHLELGREGRITGTANEYGVSFEDEEEVLELDSGDQSMTLQIY